MMEQTPVLTEQNFPQKHPIPASSRVADSRLYRGKLLETWDLYSTACQCSSSA